MADYDDQHNPYSYAEDDDQLPQAGVYYEQPRTSLMAVASLLTSVIFCCPLTTILAIILGIGALLSIRANPDQRKGKGLAITGIVLGSLFTIGMAIMIPYGISLNNKTTANMQAKPGDALQSGFAGDIAGFKQSTQGGLAAATDDEIEAFLTELETRYGKFQSMKYDQTEFQNNPPSFEELTRPVIDYPYLIEFENATVPAKVGITTIGSTGEFLWGDVNIVDFYIIDSEQGDIIFPTNRYQSSQSNASSDSSDADEQSDNRNDSNESSNDDNP